MCKNTILVLMLLSAAWAREKAQSIEQPLTQGSTLVLRLSGGDYEVTAAKGDVVRVEYEANDEEHLQKVQVNLDTSSGVSRKHKAKSPTLSVSETPNSNFKMRIEVPVRTNLLVRMSAGDFRLSGVSGDKDVTMHAGDVDIDIGDVGDYGDIQVSTKVGEIDANAFDVQKSGMARNFSKHGSGSHKLYVHVGVGEIKLRSEGK